MNGIVAMGRGGTGKSSFVALLARYLIEHKDIPLPLIDADLDTRARMYAEKCKESGCVLDFSVFLIYRL